MAKNKRNSLENKQKTNRQAGFSLIEVVVALLVMTVFLLGSLAVFTYAVQYNRGNNLRSQAITVLQKEAEVYRSDKFVPSYTHPDLVAGTKTAKDAQSADNSWFTVSTTVDNDPATGGIQTTNESTTTLKEIKITVTPKYATANWEKAVVTTATIQRVRGN